MCNMIYMYIYYLVIGILDELDINVFINSVRL